MGISKKLLLAMSIVVLLASSISALVPASDSAYVTTQYENPSVVSLYDVYMHPVGLSAGSIWNVTVSGTTYTSSSNLISFTLQSGQYTFTASTHAMGISWNNAFNTFTVNNSSVNVSVYFTPTQNQYIGNITVRSYPVGVAFDPYNNYMYVSNSGNSTVSVINQSNVVIRNILVQYTPYGIAFDPYNNYIYVDNFGSNTVSVINQSNIVIKNITVQSAPYGIAFDPYNNYMYVANSGNDTVSVINQSNIVIKNITVQSAPHGIAFDPYNNYMYVANSGNDTVSVINQSNMVIRNITVGTQPAWVAFNPYNNYMYVDNVFNDTVSILSSTYDIAFYNVLFTEKGLPTGATWNITLSGSHFSSDSNMISIQLTPAEYTFTAATQAIEMSAENAFNTFTIKDSSINVSVYFTQNQYIGNIKVQYDPTRIAFDPYNNYMYVANYGSSTVSVINQSNIVIKNMSVQTNPEGVAFDPYNNYMYVANSRSSTVSVINQSNIVIKNITVQSEPDWVAFDPYNNYMYVANSGNDTVSVINQSNIVIKNILVQSAPYGIAFDPYNNYMYVTNSGNDTVSVINQSNIVIKNMTVQSYPEGIAFDPYNNYMYVANYGSSTVSVINQSNIVIRNITVQSNPYGIAFDPYNDYMYVTNLASGTVSVINQSNVVIKNITGQSYPEGIAFDSYNDYMYVTNFLTATVSILSSTHDIAFYNVQFTEKGLPTGTTWNITLSGRHFSSDSNMISIRLTPAEYTYSATNSNSSYLPVKGTFDVSSNMIVNVQFPEKMYHITFTETGLPSGTAWYLNLTNGQSFMNNTDKISFYEPNGSYAYTTSSAEGRTYSSSMSSGTFQVAGSPYSSSVVFSEVTYQVTFKETGLPLGTTWYLNLTDGQAFTSSSNSISFSEPNGSYAYIISSDKGRTYSSSMSSGTFIILGSPYSLSVTFSEVTYQVTFTETGLPSGTAWYISLDNSSLFASSQSNNLIQLPNGTYYITAISTSYTSNFTGNQTHEVLIISGSTMTVHLTFTKLSSVVSTPSSSSNDLLIAIGSAAGVIVGVAVGFFVFRKKR